MHYYPKTSLSMNRLRIRTMSIIKTFAIQPIASKKIKIAFLSPLKDPQKLR